MSGEARSCEQWQGTKLRATLHDGGGGKALCQLEVTMLPLRSPAIPCSPLARLPQRQVLLIKASAFKSHTAGAAVGVLEVRCMDRIGQHSKASKGSCRPWRNCQGLQLSALRFVLSACSRAALMRLHHVIDA